MYWISLLIKFSAIMMSLYVILLVMYMYIVEWVYVLLSLIAPC